MTEVKLKRSIIGVYVGMAVLLVAMVLVWKLRSYDKVNADIAAASGELETARGTANELGSALFAQAKAEHQLELATSQVNFFRARFRNLPFDVRTDGTRNATWIRYMNEYFSEFGLALRRQLVTAADETGVVINTTVKVEAPPQNPEDMVNPPSGYLKPVSGGAMNLEVTGALPNILRFFERINQSQTLMLVGNVKLEGVAPIIKATTTVTPYLVASGPSAQLAAPAAAPAPANEGGAPGGAPPGEAGAAPPAQPAGDE